MSTANPLERLVDVSNVSKVFGSRPGRARRGEVKALDNVSLQVARGQWYGLVGESGSGKSTLARIIAGLEEPTQGDVLVSGEPPDRQGKHARLSFARKVQFVYQDAIGALNPRMTVFDLVAEPLRIHGTAGAAGNRQGTVEQLLADVGLDKALAAKRPGQLSGGQCQRVTLARAMALDPQLMILDEPTSSLDVSVQAQIIGLLQTIQAERELTVIMISHDLAMVSHTCEYMSVMSSGHIVERGDTLDIIANPQHPYTQELLESVPQL